MLRGFLPLKLVVVNYSMDKNDPLLSHQIEAVRNLAQYFDEVQVVTGHVGLAHVPQNVIVKNMEWKEKRALRNALKLLFLTLPLLAKKNVILFSHMTDVQAAIIAPFAKAFRVKHIQWYAHKKYSRYLKFSKMFVDGVVTSTPGSCPISGDRVFPIGQALISESFIFKPKHRNEFKNAIHIGRFDPSKDIFSLAETCLSFSTIESEVLLTQIGSPTTKKAREYAKEFETRFADQIENKSIVLLPSITRSAVSQLLPDYDFFIHAYLGSLDKTLLEATLSGIPVITINPEYHSVFGTWSGLSYPTLADEFDSLRSNSQERINSELILRREICERYHSLQNWTNSLLSVFSNV